MREDREAERRLADGRYDLVIGNPPGNGMLDFTASVKEPDNEDFGERGCTGTT